jgi:hypothetical protein
MADGTKVLSVARMPPKVSFQQSASPGAQRAMELSTFAYEAQSFGQKFR